MFVEYEFYVGFKDCREDLKVKNSSLLTYFENVAGIHGNLAGDGLKETLTKTFTAWLLVSWKLKVIKRPEHGQSIKVRTWVTGFKRVYSFREFEVLSQDNEVLAVCSSKWVLINTKKGMPERISEEKYLRYEQEDKTNFDENADVIIKEPLNYIKNYKKRICRDWIDMNYHMNNTWYLTLAHLAFDENSMDFPEADEVEILYKKEVKLGETVECLIWENDKEYIATVKSVDGSTVHALIRLLK